MTTQRQKDLAKGCEEALKHRFADHPSFADGYASGATYGRRDVAKRIQLVLASDMDEQDMLINLDIISRDLEGTRE